MTPLVKNLCNAESEADVMGPVDNGERIIAKNGPSSVGNGTSVMSICDLANIQTLCRLTHLAHLSSRA